MLDKNYTKFAAIGFEQRHRDGITMAVVAVRARFVVTMDEDDEDEPYKLELADKQELVLADEYAGNPQTTDLLRTSDLIPFKPSADVTVLAKTRPPNVRENTSWSAGVKVGSHEYTVRVNGKRHWLPPSATQPDWRLEAPIGMVDMLMTYRYASGGKLLGDIDGMVDPRNPIGTGLLDRGKTPQGKPILAPLIDSVAAPVGDPFGQPEPQGFAPVPPDWHWRQRHAGTYDLAKRGLEPSAGLARDFDYRFYQVAHPKLVLPTYLQGDEHVQLRNLAKGFEIFNVSLPGVAPYATFHWDDGRRMQSQLNCDGLHIDLRDDHNWTFDLTWRGWVITCPRFLKIDLNWTDVMDPNLRELPRPDIDGVDVPSVGVF